MIDNPTAKDRIAFLRNLRAVRRFRLEPVPQEIINDVLEVARWSGSSSNRQPWELVVVRDPATLLALAAVDGPPGPNHLAGAPLGIVPTLAGRPTEFDEGRLTERIMLAAAAHGLGSSIAGFWGDQPAAVKAILHIPAEFDVRVAISVGYPADTRARLVGAERDVDTRQPLTRIPLGRKPLTEIVHLERYGRRHDNDASLVPLHWLWRTRSRGMALSTGRVQIRDEDRATLSWTRSSSVRAGLAAPEKIVLAAADGEGTFVYRAAAGVSRPTVICLA